MGYVLQFLKDIFGGTLAIKMVGPLKIHQWATNHQPVDEYPQYFISS